MTDIESAQRVLAPTRIQEFHHDLFVDTQLQDFEAICTPRLPPGAVVVDMGGGCGFFAAALRQRSGFETRVVDADPTSLRRARELGVEAEPGDALAPAPRGDEDVVCFNLILHHLVGRGSLATRQLQLRALESWRTRGVRLFVHEYVYDSWLPGDASARFIHAVTSSRVLSRLAAIVARFIPALRANTFGVGVRFHGADAWLRLFQAAGWHVVASRRGEEEILSLARAVLLVKSCRRDSFVLSTVPE